LATGFVTGNQSTGASRAREEVAMTAWTSGARRVSLAAVALAVSVAAAHADPPVLWRDAPPARVKALDYTPLGSLLVQLQTGLVAMDPETGEHLWSRADVAHYVLLPGTPLAVVTTPGGLAVTDLESGEDRWRFAALGFSSVRGMVPLLPAGLILVYGETPESPHAVVAAAYESGEVAWIQAGLFATPALAPKARKVQYAAHALDTDHTAILDPTEDGLIRLDLLTGALLWRIPQDALDSGRKPIAMFAADGRLFASYERKLLAIDTAEGRVLWTRKDRFPAPVFQLASTPAGLLVRGGYNVGDNGRASWKPYLTLLDPATGATKWTTVKTRFDGRSAFLLEEDAITIAHRKGVGTYDLASGAMTGGTELPEFSGGEDPCCLERFEGGRLLVSSSQNLRMIDEAGQPVYSIYHKAPGASFLAKLASTALLVAVSAASQATAPPGGAYWVPTGNPVLTMRHKATIDAERFTYIFTEAPGGDGQRFALVRIDKESGLETGRLWFADRSPLFRLDPVTGIAVVVENDTLVAMRFEPAGME
jgi:hypothetical protein